MTEELKKLSELCDQETLFDLDGWFMIKKFDPWHFWIENADGEGFQIQKAELLSFFVRLFKEKF